MKKRGRPRKKKEIPYDLLSVPKPQSETIEVVQPLAQQPQSETPKELSTTSEVDKGKEYTVKEVSKLLNFPEWRLHIKLTRFGLGRRDGFKRIITSKEMEFLRSNIEQRFI